MRTFKLFALLCAVTTATGLIAAASPAHAGGLSGIDVEPSVSPDTVSSGGEVLWETTLFNDTDTVLTGVHVSFQITGGKFDLTATKSFTNGATCKHVTPGEDGPADELDCKVGTLDVGEGDNQASFGVVMSSAGVESGDIFGQEFASEDTGDFAGSGFVTIHVTPVSTTETSGFVKPGGTISVGPKTPDAADPTVGSFTLPKKEFVDAPAFGAASAPKPQPGPGATITISVDNPANEPGACGGQNCNGKIINISDFSGYNDPLHPALFKLSWAANVLGANSVLYLIKPGSPHGIVMSKCTKTRAGYNTPCLLKHSENKKTHKISDTIAILSGDPGGARRG